VGVPVIETLPVGALLVCWISAAALVMMRFDPVVPLMVRGMKPFFSTVEVRIFISVTVSPFIVATPSVEMASTIDFTKSE
jgi:hypothetical protein